MKDIPRYYLVTIATGRVEAEDEVRDLANAEGVERYGVKEWEQLLRERRYHQMIRDLRGSSSLAKALVIRTLGDAARAVDEALQGESLQLRRRVDVALTGTLGLFEEALAEVSRREEIAALEGVAGGGDFPAELDERGASDGG